jgi:hypothetical protein
MMRDNSVADKLKAERAKFWKITNFDYDRSTFGTAPKSEKLEIDDRYSNAFAAAQNWSHFNFNDGNTSSRPTTGINFGRVKFPSVTEYNLPAPDVLSKKPRSPVYTMKAPLPGEFYVPPWRPKTPGPNKYDISSTFVPHDKAKPLHRSSTIKMVRQATRSPGPCQYPDAYLGDINMKFERPKSAVMPPRKSTRPRTTMDLENIRIHDSYQVDPLKQPEVSDEPGPGDYNLVTDPRNIATARTIGIKLILPGQKGEL